MLHADDRWTWRRLRRLTSGCAVPHAHDFSEDEAASDEVQRLPVVVERQASNHRQARVSKRCPGRTAPPGAFQIL